MSKSWKKKIFFTFSWKNFEILHIGISDPSSAFTLKYQRLESHSVQVSIFAFQWRHNEHGGVSNHQPHHCFNRLFRHRSKKTSKLRVTGLCARNSPVTGEFPAQMASNAENGSIWWRHHVFLCWPSHPARDRLMHLFWEKKPHVAWILNIYHIDNCTYQGKLVACTLHMS